MTRATLPAKSDIALSIGEVSRLISVPPGVLRSWEREALILPDRTEGGHRIYRNHHLRRLRKIARLYFVEKLNPTAIRRELGPEKERRAGNFVDWALGQKLRSIRKKKGMTLNQTAGKSGLSASFISALERGNTGVSLEALFRLSEALGTTIPSLKGLEETGTATSHFVKADERQRFETDDGLIVIEDLIPKPAGMEAQISTFEVGAESDGEYSHRGQEFLIVLEGQLAFWLEPGTRHDLLPGDVMYLHSHLKHRWRNEGPTPTRVLWVNAALPHSATSDPGAAHHTAVDVPSEPLMAGK